MSETPETDKLDDKMGEASICAEEDYMFMMSHARNLERERDKYKSAIGSFRQYCKSSCDARTDCDAYVDRGTRCPDCPLDYWEELECRIEDKP